MKNITRVLATGVGMVLIMAVAARAQETTGFINIFHDPFLNWDFCNYTNQTVNDFEIIVKSPDFVPQGTYVGSLGFPHSQVTYGDFNGDGIQETKLTWWGRDIAPGAIAHVGAGMLGSGPILDAYWTLDGRKVDGSMLITYERTMIRIPVSGIGGNEVWMRLNSVNGSLQLRNIQTYVDIPASLLSLDDLNSNLDMGPLQQYRRLLSNDTANLNADSFFDIFIDVSTKPGRDYEALLVADMVDPLNNNRVIGQFWNLNPQCPEPGSLTLLGIGGLMLLRRRKR